MWTILSAGALTPKQAFGISTLTFALSVALFTVADYSWSFIFLGGFSFSCLALNAWIDACTSTLIRIWTNTAACAMLLIWVIEAIIGDCYTSVYAVCTAGAVWIIARALSYRNPTHFGSGDARLLFVLAGLTFVRGLVAVLLCICLASALQVGAILYMQARARQRALHLSSSLPFGPALVMSAWIICAWAFLI